MKKTLQKTLLLCSIIQFFWACGVYAQQAGPITLQTAVKWESQCNSMLNFEENKGQMADVRRHVNNDLLFKATTGDLDIYITTTGISYVFTHRTYVPDSTKKQPLIDPTDMLNTKSHRHDKVMIQYYRSDMELVGADIRKENIIKEGESPDRHDYYLGDICPNGVLNVHTYQQITIKNIYPGVDWVLYTAPAEKAAKKTGGLQYDFIVHPGADPSVIKLRAKYADNPELQSDGSLKLHTPMGDIIQDLPVSYMYNDEALPAGTDYRNVSTLNSGASAPASPATHYIVKDNEISFKVDDGYDKTRTLIIDPDQLWTSYLPVSTGSDALAITNDGTNVFLGNEYTPTGFPDPSGSYETTSGNTSIQEFTTKGVAVWATDYGGSGGDYLDDLKSDGSFVWVTGASVSTNFPCLTIAGGYSLTTDPQASGNEEQFLLEFNTDGAREYATYFGGGEASNENNDAISPDGTHVWVTGYAGSTSGFPITSVSGSFNQSTSGTGIVAELNESTKAIVWCTYLPANVNDVSSDGTAAWITGETSSTAFPPQTSIGSSYQSPNPTAGGGFIMAFQCSNTALLWATNFGTSALTKGLTQGDFINSDGTDVWVTGRVTGTGGGSPTTTFNFPIKTVSGAYNQTATGSVGNTNTFILEFTADPGVEVWGTYLAGSGPDIPMGVSSDGTNVWVIGSSNSTSGFPVFEGTTCTGSYYQATLDGGTQDVFLAEFSATTEDEEWISFFGADAEAESYGEIISAKGGSVFFSGDFDHGLAGTGISYPMQSLSGATFNNTTTAGQGTSNEYSWIASFSTCVVVTPINLLYFNCTPASTGNGFDLAWATGSEQNNKSFTIERSSDGVNFYDIATIQGAGNSSFTRTYTYTDASPLNGINYYKLSQTDYYGGTTEVGTSACNNDKDTLMVYPNPSGGQFTVQLPAQAVLNPSTVSLYDLLGREVYTQTVQNQPTLNISVPILSSSIYLLRVVTVGKTYIVKLVVKK